MVLTPARSRPCFALFLLAVAMVARPCSAGSAADPRIPLSVSFATPLSPVVDSAVNLRSGYGLSLGYLYTLNKHVAIGAHGVVEHLYTVQPASNALTTYQMLASVRYRLFPFSASPYAQVEGGMAVHSVQDDVEALRLGLGEPGSTMGAVGTRIGALIPISETVDFDGHVRYGATFARTTITTLSFHAGIVLRLQR